MHIKRLFLFFCFLSLSPESKASFLCIKNNPQNPLRNISIGVVIDRKSRLGKEQRTAVEVALDDLRRCINVSLHIRDSNGSQARATSEALDLLSTARVDAILGPTTPQEAALLSEFTAGSIPIVSLSRTASIPRNLPLKLPSYVQFSMPISYQTGCISAIVGYFKWKEVILIQEAGNIYSEDRSLAVSNHLSDSLGDVGASVESHFTFPKLSSLPDPAAYIEGELKRVRRKNARVLVLMHVSLEFSILLFEKAKALGMMEKGYAWIVSDEVANFLDSLDSSVIHDMQGVVGFKTYYDEKTDRFRDFKSKFRRKYASRYPAEEEYSNPSLYSLLAYDAVSFVSNPTLGGVIASQRPVFSVVNVIGKSYSELAFWSEQYGFSNDLKDLRTMNYSNDNGAKNIDELGTILWPGGDRNVPRGVSLGSEENPLVIGVSANCTFRQFVQVINDTAANKTLILGFSISVFNASISQLPRPPAYRFENHYGTYDEMITKVSNKTYHAAVGDTAITAKRYAQVDFSQPYMESDLVMIVPVKPAMKDSKFLALHVFTGSMWIQFGALGVLTGAIIWLSEHAVGNKHFPKTPFLGLVGSILWLSVTVISLSQKERIKTTTSKLVITAWLVTVFVVGACFTAVLSSMLIVPRLQASITDLDSLRNSDAFVGCNANSFICPYLTDVLRFNPNIIRRVTSFSDYDKEFSTARIKAAFLQSPHAKLFLGEHCNKYVIAGPSFKLGGLGFVFEKGARMAGEVSEAILMLTQSGQLEKLKKELLTSSDCTSSPGDNVILGDQPFSGLFEVLGGLIGTAFLIAIFRLARRKVGSTTSVRTMLIKNRIGLWAFVVLTECCTRFGASFFRRGDVRRRTTSPRLAAIELVSDGQQHSV